MERPQKTRIELLYDPVIPFLGWGKKWTVDALDMSMTLRTHEGKGR